MLLEYGGIAVGQIVLFNDLNKGWVPAVVESIVKPATERDAPKLNLVVLVTGYHQQMYQKLLAEHGKNKGEWMLPAEVAAVLLEPDKARAEAERKQLAALNELEELSKQSQEEPPEEDSKTRQKAKAAK